MTQLFSDNGQVIPVTKIQAGPCLITQVKSSDKDGYTAVQIGFDHQKHLSKALQGHLKNLDNFRYLREFRLIKTGELKRGDQITVTTFAPGEKIKVSGISKGKGFQGVVRRHGFHGSPASHGHKDQLRMGGSIGATEPARVFKGMRMPGHMGSEKITVKNLKIIKIDPAKNILFVNGAVPGSRHSLIEISANGDLQVNQEKPETAKKKTNH